MSDPTSDTLVLTTAKVFCSSAFEAARVNVVDLVASEAGPLTLNSASSSSFFLRFPFVVDTALEVALEVRFEVLEGDPFVVRPRRFVAGAVVTGGSFIVS